MVSYLPFWEKSSFIHKYVIEYTCMTYSSEEHKKVNEGQSYTGL